MTTRNFEAGNERTVTGALAKSRSKGMSVSVENGEQKESVRKETPAVSATMNKHEKRTRSSSPTLKSPTNNDRKKSFEKEATSPSGKRLQKPFRDHL